MGRPQWVIEKMNDKTGLIPSPKMPSRHDFRIPATVESDFKHLLQHDIPNVNFTYEYITDWYETQKEDYVPVFIRGQQTPIDWKSKIGNSDMSTNIKVPIDCKIRKGDIVVRQDGLLFLVSWNISLHPNNIASQLLQMNDYLVFTRKHELKIDDYGFQIDDTDSVDLDQFGRQIICPKMPVSYSQYSGRPQYSIAQSQPGIVPNNLINMYVQYNQKTKNLRIDDEAVIYDYRYSIQNIFFGQVDINHEYGCIYLQMKRVPGGDVNAGN